MQMKFQLGKHGITDGVVASLQNAFRTHKLIKISVLPSATEERRDHMKAIAEELIKRLKGTYTYATIGFVIILKRKGMALK